MKYTLDSPNQATEVFLTSPDDRFTPLNKVPLGLLLPLPNSSRKTANMFVDYGTETWKGEQPKFCVISLEDGSPVLQWKGKPITINTQKQLDKLTIGTLKKSRVMGEIGSLNPILYIEQTKVLT